MTDQDRPLHVPIHYLNKAAFEALTVRLQLPDIAGKGHPEQAWLRMNSASTTVVPAHFLSEPGAAFDPSRPTWAYLSKISGQWWHTLQRGIAPFQLGRDGHGVYGLRGIHIADSDWQVDPGWAIAELGGLSQLPAHMALSEYDIGHTVVVIGGEQMGTIGQVRQIHLGGYQLASTATHKAEYLAAVRSGNLRQDLELAPLRVRCPVGSMVWVLAESRWEPGRIGEYSGNFVKVWLDVAQQTWEVPRSRAAIRPRVEGEAPPALLPVLPKESRVPPSVSGFAPQGNAGARLFTNMARINMGAKRTRGKR